MPILPTIQEPADLRGFDEVQLAQLAVEIRDTIVRDRGAHRRSPRLLARGRRADDRAPPAARVAPRSDRLGHRPPGLPAQAAHRPAGALRHVAPARRRRRVPATVRVGARRVRWRTCRDRPVDRGGARRGARPASRARAGRRGRRRRRAHERAVARGAQRHRPSPDAAPDRAQRQRDVDQPDRRRVLDVPLADQAVANVAPGQERLRPDRRADPGRRRRPSSS